jgi:hypothetical protein
VSNVLASTPVAAPTPAESAASSPSAIVGVSEARDYSIPWGAIGSRAQRSVLLVAYWIVGTFFVHASAGELALLLPIGLFVLVSFGALKIRVGDDGLLVGGRFFPYAKVAFHAGGKGELRVFGDARYLNLYMPSGRSWRLSREDQVVRELAEQIELRIAGYRARSAPNAELALAASAPSQRGFRHSVQALRAGLGSSYRQGALDPELLWQVAADASAESRVRVAAVATLAASASESDRLRLTELAAATASPEVRVALETATDPARDAELFDLVSDDRDLAKQRV